MGLLETAENVCSSSRVRVKRGCEIMRKKLQKITECLTAGVVLLLALAAVTGLVMRKNYIKRVQPFYDQTEDFDVLFFGTSHVENGIFPMELWEDHGIVSYNLGTSGQQLGTIYWYMKNALEYQKPKLVVIDCYWLNSNAKASSDFGIIQELMDVVPLSALKLQAISDLLVDPEMERRAETDHTINLKERRAEPLLWGYYTYHDRWDELGQDDFALKFSTEKGAVLQPEVAASDLVARIPREQKLEKDTVAMGYVRKMIEECQAQNIEVLLTYLPFAANEQRQEEANTVYQLAAEYDVKYINFLEEDVVNYQTDFRENNNENGHLNASGARKVTDYLGRYIRENYEIGDQRQNPVYADWNDDYAEYAMFKENTLKNLKDLNQYLMLLADKNYDIIIEWDPSGILQDEMRRNLLANLGVDAEKVTDATGFSTIKEAGAAVDYAEEIYDSREAVSDSQSDFQGSRDGEKELLTSLGTFRAVPVEDGGYMVYRNEKELYTVSAEQSASADIRIVVCDKDTMQVVDRAEFSIAEQSVRK